MMMLSSNNRSRAMFRACRTTISSSPVPSTQSLSNKRSREDSPGAVLLRSAKVVVTERKHYQQEIDQLKTDLTEARDKIEDIQWELDKKEEDLIRRDMDVSHMTALHEKKIESKKKHKAHITILTSTNATLITEKATLASENATLITEKSTLTSKNATLTASNAQLLVNAAMFASKCAELEAIIAKHEKEAESNVEDSQNTSTDVFMGDATAGVQEMVLGQTKPKPPKRQLWVKLRYVNWAAKIGPMARQSMEEVLRHVFDMLCLYDVRQQHHFKRVILSALSGTLVPYINSPNRDPNDIAKGILIYWYSNLVRASDDQLKNLLDALLKQVLDENFKSQSLWYEIARGIRINRLLTARHLPMVSYEDFEFDTSDGSDNDSSSESDMSDDSDAESEYGAPDYEY
ncbi:hypothetical protein E2P81_ATG00665 [Venturia nashicola]|nr:hypothetical protein E2P81_ATG00665 [Venturia nashicola]